MKHHWHEAAFIPDLDDGQAAWTVASRFLKPRQDDFVGGFVLRRFEQFTSAEVRTWWINGQCVLSGSHPDTPDDTPPDEFDPSQLHPLIGAVHLAFVTADLAQRADGIWRVVELGDGQVCDRPATVSPTTTINVLFRASR